MRRAVLAAFVGALAMHAVVESKGGTAPPDALTFFKNYFITGDYVVGGVGLRGTGVNGIATGTIDLTNANIPDGVDILAAFLYWETVETVNDASGAAGATFRGNDISAIARPLNPAGTAPCWSSGGGTGASDGAHRLIVYRADVLRFIPIATSGPDTGKHVVKTTYQVQLPDAGTGNVVPATAGATLVVVYRDRSMPLRSIVIYDGGYTMDQNTGGMNQTLQGFYQASTTMPPAFKMTQIVGNGQANFAERLLFNGQVIADNPFTGALGPAWDNPTFDATTSPGMTLAAGAASATVAVDHGGSQSFDCLSWGATIFSTTVQDTDGDGLLDVWESSTGTLYDPNGQPLPNLRAMGANPGVKDIFVEIGYMTTPGYNEPDSIEGPVPAHSHLPTRAALDMVGNAFKAAPVANPNGSTGINIHFDVGANYETVPPDPYIIPAALARGGESIPETACVPDATRTCQFPAYPGTVGWKSAYRFYRDEPLSYPPPPAGVTSEEQACVLAGAACQRRFDRSRKDMFHYALFAHAVGLPRSDDPSSPAFHVPRNTSGIADLVGGDILVTLGFWDDHVGTDFMQASTLMHELGHNLSLRHGGAPFEPNCKPNYLSVMNYLFQVRGLQNQATGGAAVLDYSRQALGPLDANRLSEAAGIPSLPYFTRWYAPVSASFVDTALGTTPATHHCDGSPINPAEGGWVRVDGTSLTPPIDWNMDGVIATAPLAQDISFNGPVDPNVYPFSYRTLNASSNDWALVDLRQVGSRRGTGSPRIGGGLSLDVGFGDVGSGDVGFGDVGFGDVGFGDVGFGDVGFGDVGFGDVGFGDVGFGDVGFGDVGAPRGDLDLDTATSLGNAPDSLRAALGKNSVTLNWKAPHVGSVNVYSVYRVVGAGITPANFDARVLVGVPPAPTTTLVDTTTKKNVTYTYFVTASLSDGTQTGISNLATILTK